MVFYLLDIRLFAKINLLVGKFWILDFRQERIIYKFLFLFTLIYLLGTFLFIELRYALKDNVILKDIDVAMQHDFAKNLSPELGNFSIYP